jgi:hypothetical protein
MGTAVWAMGAEAHTGIFGNDRRLVIEFARDGVVVGRSRGLGFPRDPGRVDPRAGHLFGRKPCASI